MLAYGLKDPYTRFITPSEFEAMRKYDVTGVGLNLATAEEFSRKSGMSLPEDRKDAEVGDFWLSGMLMICHSRGICQRWSVGEKVWSHALQSWASACDAAWHGRFPESMSAVKLGHVQLTGSRMQLG